MSSSTPSTPSAWPYWTLLMCGHFGRATPASRRLRREALLGLVLLASTVAIGPLLKAVVPGGRLMLPAGAALSAAMILRAYRRYFSDLDELSLRIQYEAIAFSFGWMLLLGITASAAMLVIDFRVHPLWIVIAEPLRGLGLVLAARRYR